ncbi:MAG: WYL domain-containing protein [Polyangiaceae bacterium]|jgi:predicted DNA-binding transcriptional regulator YafY
MPVRPIPRPKVPRVGRPSGRFTQHRRIDFLREKLEAHTAGLTLEELAAMLRITTRSVRRYLRELALVTELESIALQPGGAHVWRIKPSERGRAVVLRRTQAYALLAARPVFDVLRGSALFDEIDLALREIEQVAHRPTTRPSTRDAAGDGRLDERFAYAAPAAHAYPNRAEDVDELFRAVAELRVLRFRHRDRSDKSGRGARVIAHAYALVLDAGAITCVTRDVDLGSTRTFAFDAMSELEASEEERFELPADFAIQEWLHGDFGVARGGRPVRVLVEFEPRVGEAIRGRRVHPTQKVAVAADGRVRASMQVPELPEVMDRVRRWILGFGATARVLEPLGLAEEIALELRRAAERYRT